MRKLSDCLIIDSLDKETPKSIAEAVIECFKTMEQVHVQMSQFEAEVLIEENPDFVFAAYTGKLMPEEIKVIKNGNSLLYLVHLYLNSLKYEPDKIAVNEEGVVFMRTAKH